DFSGDDENITVSKEETDFATLVNVKLNRNLNVDSVQAGDYFMNSNMGIGFGGDAYITQNGLDANNNVISNVAAGVYNTDAVNVGQLKEVEEVAANANKGWNLSTNGVATEATNVAPGEYVDFSGDKNISVSHDGTKVKAELNKDLVDIESISNGDAKLTLGGLATELTNGQGASVKLFGDATIINGKVNVYNDGRIAGVAAGINDTDAVNVSQLKNSAWKLAANGVLTEAEDVKAGDYVDFNGDQNVSVSKDVKDGVKTVKVELNKDLVGIESISNDGASLTLNGTATELTNGKGAAITLFGDTTTINNKVTVYNDGRISGVAAGINDTDAVNVSQLKAVGTTANMGWNLATNGVATEATNVKPGDYVDFSGDKNISVSHDGTKVQVELNKDIDVNSVQTNALNSKYNLSVGTMAENGIMPFFVNSTGDFYAAHNKFSVDKDGKVTATAGEIGNVVLNNGVFYKNSALRDGELFIGDADGNYSQITPKSAKLGKVTIDKDGKISGVAAGAVTADSTDAVNGSQLHAVATEAGKHSKVVNGSNINVEEFDNDGQKIYKVNLNKDIMLGDLTGKYVSISGTNGTIETTGAIATQDRVYADKGAKLADIDVTGNKISNGASSIVLDGNNVKVNDKVTIDQNGKISGVAAGEISSTSTDAINGSQLHQTNENVAANRADIDKNKADIAALDNRVTKNEQDIKQNAADIAQNKADIATNKADIATNKADIATNKANIAQNAADIKKVEALAKKHTTVTEGKNIKVTEGTNADGGKEYNVALDKDINLDSVTTGQTVMNNDGLKVGKDVSVTATAVTAGKTSISDEGVKVGDKTYISDKGLNANDQKVTNVAAGEISATSKDAVNGSQLYATNQEVANNTNRINKLGSRVNKVGAGAAALAALHPMDFDPDDKLTFSAGYGNYAGENAAAIGAYYRPDEKVMFSVAGTVGNGENMVNAGVSFALDRTNHVSNSRTALAREVIDLRGQLAVMGAKMAKMEKAFGMLDETKTKLFPDVPANHWAYEYIAKLAGNGYIEGYPDGNFGGDRLMTRYEFAAMLYRAIENGAALEEKIIKEFEPELGRIRVDRISGEDGDRDKIERVRVNDTKGERDHYGNKLAK
ncbi:YadA-like family protein, partial [Phascolarctobacterium succinatutens]|uniref:YadA-like family protein n=1 Tax=Phascolarctobacterium succinatutens TaxID=626940 RepID=UPI00307A4943